MEKGSGEERDEERAAEGKEWGKRAIWGRETEGSWAGRLVRGAEKQGNGKGERRGQGEGIERARRGQEKGNTEFRRHGRKDREDTREL